MAISSVVTLLPRGDSMQFKAVLRVGGVEHNGSLEVCDRFVDAI
jgi:hypothetical protein